MDDMHSMHHAHHEDETLHGLGDIQGDGDNDTDDCHEVEGEKYFGPFDERYKDIIVAEMIIDGQFIQVNGWDLDGRKVWIQLSVPKAGYIVKHATHPSV